MEQIEIDIDSSSSSDGDDVVYVKECYIPDREHASRKLLSSSAIGYVPPSLMCEPSKSHTVKRSLTEDITGLELKRPKWRHEGGSYLPIYQNLFPAKPNYYETQPLPYVKVERPVETNSVGLENIMTDATEEMDPPPGTMAVPLMLHQRLALCWMVKRERGPMHERGGILADDQGLGKTITALALIVTNRPRTMEDSEETYKPRGGTLVVCPAVVLKQWEREIQTKVHDTAEISLRTHHGKDKADSALALTHYSVVITTYNSLLREAPISRLKQGKRASQFGWDSDDSNEAIEIFEEGPVFGVHWFRVILDESQYIKNRRSFCSRSVMELSADCRWCMSGTPIQNSLDDLYPIFKFLRHPEYSSHRSFERYINRPSCKDGPGMTELRKALSGQLLRRTKHSKVQGVPILQLPEKILTVAEAVMSPDEYAAYSKVEEQVRSRYLAMVHNKEKSYLGYLIIILRLRQAASHPWLWNRCSTSRKPKWSPQQLKDAEKLSQEERDRLIQQLGSMEAICPICHDIPDVPVAAYCKHIFCESCLETEIESEQEASCPVCFHTLHAEDYYSRGCLQAASGQAIDLQKGSMKRKKWVSSAKVDKLLELLREIHRKQRDPEEPPEKVLIFSQWTTMLDLIEIPLEMEGFKFARVDGQMSLPTRFRVIEQFKEDPTITILLVSLKAASVGINLCCANHVILNDLWWNPAVEEQAIDRTHRIGQTRPVTITRLTVKDTLDQKILALQARKVSLMKSAVRIQGDVNVSGKLSLQDIHFLFDFKSE